MDTETLGWPIADSDADVCFTCESYLYTRDLKGMGIDCWNAHKNCQKIGERSSFKEYIDFMTESDCFF